MLGIVLEIAERVGRKEREIESLTLQGRVADRRSPRRRAGAGRVALRLDDLRRPVPRPGRASAAARYSFLLSVPAVVLSGLFELKDVGNGGGAGAVPTIIATFFAFVVGYASIAWLLKYLTKHPVTLFVVYRVVLGVVVLTLVATGAVTLNG